MPRIGEPRAPARPATDDQENRRGAILAAASRLGSVKEIDRIQAQEIAADAGVALRTLYRYYPSKHHVFAAVLDEQVVHFRPPAPSGVPTDDIAALMVAACRNLLHHRHLAHAMITSTQIVRAQADAPDDPTLRELILKIAGVDSPTDEQLRRTRLVQQAAFGILTWTVGGALGPEDALADVDVACRLLVGDVF
ncbi:TetR family transcriptional regulator [Mycolicibacterium sphagni]|uniref:TetR family transcriptional regulator n=1 Tax=Mycolicibacterium sphagni TaxID=1786 RepID=A0A255DV34_9MYCO|nr:TetR family transcriptional regulator [Mycolicibacterium sphagni]MCV7180058.1 TetR family transcriptional regulator [Mycolicibacterium sphagni]OYN80862.1 TetR family transcriptional regulator [Mycolicibacterium sphagni]